MRASNALDAATGPMVEAPSGLFESRGIALRGDWVAAWPEVQRSLWQKSRILLALDFDGVAVCPGALPPELNHLLQRLHASPRVVVAFLSSRSVRELRSRTAFDKAIYAGNHGAEIEGRGLSRTDGLAASCRSDLVDVLSCLSRYARRLPGIAIEDNGLSLSVQGAVAGSREGQKACDLLGALVQRRPRLQVIKRSGGWNVCVRASWDKGHAIRQMIDHLQIAPSSMVYLAGGEADDRTFLDLAAGHTFSFGSSVESAAKYRLSTRLDMMQFLLCVLCVVNEVSLL